MMSMPFSARIFSLKRDTLFAFILGSMLALPAAVLGHRALGRVKTDPGPERTIVSNAIKIVRGQHSYGLVDYTHFPNGAAYVLLPFLKMGILDIVNIRLIPLALSVIAMGFFASGLMIYAGSRLMRVWVVLCCFSFLTQPGFFLWQGALASHSYALSITMILIALAALSPAFKAGWFFLLGFLSGWIGYDFLPLQVVAVSLIRFLVHNQNRKLQLRQTILLALKESMVLVSGMLAAISLHFVQVILFHGSFHGGVMELIGTEHARPFFLTKNELYPSGDYSTLRNKVNPIYVCKSMFHYFFNVYWGAQGDKTLPAYVYKVSLVPTIILATAIIAAKFGVLFRGRGHPLLNEEFRRHLIVFAVAVMGVILGSTMWCLIMPLHAVVNMYVYPRHFLVGLSLIIYTSVLFWHVQSRSEETSYDGRGLVKVSLLSAACGAPLIIGIFYFAFAIVIPQL